MTDKEIVECMEYWRISLLEQYINKLEDAFEEEIKKHNIGKNFINILIRSYAHSFLVMKEIICLIKNGFPDGALARARRLYEEMVIALYMQNHKSDCDFDAVVERYFDDQDIRAYSGRIEYFKIFNNNVEIANCDTKICDIVKKHTSSSKKIDAKRREILSNNYWWANNNRMSFRKLSECLNDDYTKLLYLRACYSVHASAMGDIALLGRENPDGAKLYSGATYNGFSVPLLLAVYSLSVMSEIVFENFDIPSPIKNEDFAELIQLYFKHSAEENKETN